MVRILIAEDEYYSRRVLMKLLAELDGPLEVCCAAETGTEAVTYLRDNPVDIVITDIRMPEGDGLEVARFASEHCPQTAVIIQSGYSDFHYAQTAIRYGVKSYLTKPLKKQELAETISRLLEEQREQQRQSRMEEALRYLTIGDVVESPQLLAEFTAQCGDLFTRGGFRIGLVQTNERQDQDVMAGILQIIRQKLADLPAYAFYFHQPDEILIVSSGSDEPEGQDKLPGRLGQIVRQLPGGGTGGISRVYQRDEQITGAYRDSIYAINSRLLTGSGRVYEYQSEMPFHQLLDRQQEVVLLESIVQHRYQQAAEVIEQFFAAGRKSGIDIYSFYSGIMQLFTVINQAYSQHETTLQSQAEGRYLLFSFKADLYHYRNQEALKNYILGIVRNTCEIKETGEKHDIISEIKAYVAQNFRQDISLNELASHKYFMNPSYLSRLFKAETGDNFSKYLIRYRMERAKELLGETSFKINEISGIVGYNDPSYFIQTFKKQFDMTPEQYRAQVKEAAEVE